MAKSKQRKAKKKHPYRLKDNYVNVELDEREKDMDASEYHETPLGVIPPQAGQFGNLLYTDKDIGKQEIPLVDITTTEDGGETPKELGSVVLGADKCLSAEDKAGVVAAEPVQSGATPLQQMEKVHAVPAPVKEFFEVKLVSDVFGTITLPVLDIVQDGDNVVIVMSSEGGFNFIPPVSENPFKLEWGSNSIEVAYCGQKFSRRIHQESYLILVKLFLSFQHR